MSFPRREKPAAKVGPSLGLSPAEIRSSINEPHGLSQLLMNNEAWEPFAWKGNDLSSPLRALWQAETMGLYPTPGQRSIDIPISGVTAAINSYLMDLGRAGISENSVLSALRTASIYLQHAVGVSIVVNRKAQTVRFLDGIETAENIEKYLDQLKSKHSKVAAQISHAEACGYDVSPLLTAHESATTLQLTASRN